MKPASVTAWSILRLALRAGCFAAVTAVTVMAFPPAPHHTVYGLVRDEHGHPIDYPGAEVLLEVEASTIARSRIAPRIEPGINYRMSLPLDSGATADLYKPSALRPTVPFRMRVRIGSSIYLPIEMTGAASLLTQPGESSRVDLTLGIDADGNGLPDAWERAIAALLGIPWVPGGIQPGDMYPGSGMSYRDVYVAGTYAVDPEEGFALQILPGTEGRPKLAFVAVRGRSYTVQAAATLGEWRSVPFRALPVVSGQLPVQVYQAIETRRVEIEAPELDEAPARFFRLIVQ
jgi:hypothetical protein